LFTKVYQRWQAGDPDYFVSQFSSLANPTYPKDVVERNRRSMTPARFRMFHEGGFERPEHMVYPQWDDSKLVDPFTIPNEWWKSGGIDFGFNHPTAAIWAARDPDGIYYLTTEYRKSQALLAHHYAQITARSKNGKAPEVWYPDPSAKQSIAELRRLGLPVVPADNDVANGIDTVGTLLATGRLKVFKGLTGWIDEIEGYAYKEKDGVPTEQVIKLNDDLMDATRYLLHTAEKQAPLKLYT
jgi:phage terminase large subunit